MPLGAVVEVVVLAPVVVVLGGLVVFEVEELAAVVVGVVVVGNVFAVVAEAEAVVEVGKLLGSFPAATFELLAEHAAALRATTDASTANLLTITTVRSLVVADQHDDVVVRLERWSGPWADDDPDANFKAEIALYSNVDPLMTIRNLSAGIDVPVGVLCRYVLARWASEGSAGLLELGPTMVGHLWSAIEHAEEAGTDEARLAAYDELRQRVSWLRAPLEDEHRQPLAEE